MAKRNVKLTVQYKGTDFAGWQIQNGQETIQGAITDSIKSVTGKDVNVIGAGRTDAGVHALGQAANFIIDHHIEPARYRDAINHFLPEDIRIIAAEEVPLEFHARKSAKWKRYRYLVAGERSALWREYRWELPGRDVASPPSSPLSRTEGRSEAGVPVRLELLQRAAAIIEGDHDFAPFCVVASRKPDNRCVIHRAQWRRVGPLLVFEIRGNRFLHNMVRSLVGAMINLASIHPNRHPDNLTLERFADIIEAPKDHRIVFTAPARGLYLVSVHYSKELLA